MKQVAVTFDEQCREANAEVHIAENFFRRMIACGRMTRSECELRLARKKAIAETLKEMASRGDFPQQFKRLRTESIDL